MSAFDKAIIQAAIDLERNGYAVIPNVVSATECDRTITDMWRWLQRLNPFIDPEDSQTWKSRDKKPNWPLNTHGILQHYEVAHQAFAWKIRRHKRVRHVFEMLWGDNDLLSSFDGVCIMKQSPTVQRDRQWLHTDQAKNKVGMQCIQGLVNLNAVGPHSATLTVKAGSHKLHSDVMRHQHGNKDWCKYTPDQLAMLQGCPLVRVQGGKGSMFLWDSRAAHCNAYATRPNLPRHVIYTCYQPRALATAANLRKKAEAYRNYRVTSHWPAAFSLFPLRPRDWGNPFEHPPLHTLRNRDGIENAAMRRLAGIEQLPSSQHKVQTGLLFQQPSDLQDMLARRAPLRSLITYASDSD